MIKKDGEISQVREFMVVGPDAQGLPGELAENPVLTAPGVKSEPLPADNIEENAFTGPRSWVAKWFGPFFNVTGLPARCSMGLYLVYVGNYPLFVSSSANILSALSRHLIFSGHQAIPIDLLGREILHYAGFYNQPVSIKTALLFEDDKVILPKTSIYCYRRAAAALAFCHSTPCNKYARLTYEFEPLTLENLGKNFPLKTTMHAESTGKD